MEWITENKEWVFSGIGVFIFVSIASLMGWGYRYWKTRPEQEKSNKQSALPTYPIAASHPPFDPYRYKINPLPREKYTILKQTPLLQRPRVVQPYIGLRIQWLVTIQVVNYSDQENVHLMLLNEGKYPWVYCEAKIMDYPEIKAAQEGAKLWVAGILLGGDDNGIRIDLEGQAFVVR